MDNPNELNNDDPNDLDNVYLLSAFDKIISSYIKEFEFLDLVRESGVVNMFGSPILLSREFSMAEDKAIYIVSAWMMSFQYRKLGIKKIKNIPMDMVGRIGLDTAATILSESLDVRKVLEVIVANKKITEGK